jgi:ribose transport system permease protein
MLNLIKNIISNYGILTALILICLIIGIINPVFLSIDNLSNVLIQSSIIAIISVGMTFVIISGGIDLSVGSVVALSGMVIGYALNTGYSTPVSIMACLATGVSCGLVSGLLIAIFKVPPFIATLGMMSAARGLALMIEDGRSISSFNTDFLIISDGSFLGLASPIFIMFLIYLIAIIVAKYTYWGHYIYAIGGNERAAWLSGIPIGTYITGTYCACGLLSAASSIILTARLNSAQPIAGNSYELDAIAAVVIGGASLSGGRGTIIGTLLGALILGVLRNGLSILNISSYIQQLAIGSVIVAAVVIDKIKE